MHNVYLNPLRGSTWLPSLQYANISRQRFDERDCAIDNRMLEYFEVINVQPIIKDCEKN